MSNNYPDQGVWKQAPFLDDRNDEEKKDLNMDRQQLCLHQKTACSS